MNTVRTKVDYRACAQWWRLKCRPGDGPRPGSYFEVAYRIALLLDDFSGWPSKYYSASPEKASMNPSQAGS